MDGGRLMDIDNIIISGVRIYFPSGNELPTPSSDMLTFAVIRDEQELSDYFLVIHKDRKWSLASGRLFKEPAEAISTATKIGQIYDKQY